LWIRPGSLTSLWSAVAARAPRRGAVAVGQVAIKKPQATTLKLAHTVLLSARAVQRRKTETPHILSLYSLLAVVVAVQATQGKTAVPVVAGPEN